MGHWMTFPNPFAGPKLCSQVQPYHPVTSHSCGKWIIIYLVGWFPYLTWWSSITMLKLPEGNMCKRRDP
jgi:hypothetical protein